MKSHPVLKLFFFSLFATTAIVVSSVGEPLTHEAKADSSISLEFVGRANSGSGLGGSEIAAFDPASKRLFVTNGATNQIDIFDISNPRTPSIIRRVDLSSVGVTGVQSVASRGGLVAAAASVGGNNQGTGRVFLMNSLGDIDTRAPQGIEVGSLPDSVHFSPDGRYVLSANEGEPRDYCLTNGVLPTTTDPHGSVSIIDVKASVLSASTLDFSAYNTRAAEIRSAGGRVYGPNATVAQDLEPEYIAISADSRFAFVSLQENNAVAEINLETKSVVRIMGLGYKNHALTGSGLDPSDQDSASNSGINISNWPVMGMYQPDAIATFVDSKGERYFATANEGDAREYKCLMGGSSSGSAQAEDVRVGSVGVDGVTINASVATNGNLGRLGVTRFFPATYTNGGDATTAAASTDFTSLYTLGGRSLSIWKRPASGDIAAATLVADTGDQIERKIAELLPGYFNADWNSSTGVTNAKDTRSDNKGPEPEGLVVAKVFGRTLAFVGLERIGGIMTFDISDPTAPQYLSYVNSSVLTGVGGANFGTSGAPAGDVSPEGLLFVKASDSPIGEPLVIVANELSGTTAIFRVVGTPTQATRATSVTVSLKGTTATVAWVAPEDDGGRPIDRYVVRSRPGNLTCVTQVTKCTIKGLQRGVSYSFTVDSRVLGSSSSVTEPSPPQLVPFFDKKSAIIVESGTVNRSVAERVGIARDGRNISVVVVPNQRQNRSQQPLRYAVELWAATGEGRKVSSRASSYAMKSLIFQVRAPKAGKFRVVVTVEKNGKKSTWNGPVVVVK